MAETTRVIIEDIPGRDKLGEARSYQMAFAFLEKIEENRYRAINAFSCCKDYLNDTVFTQITGNPIVAYGFESKYIKDLFPKCGYLGVTFLNRKIPPASWSPEYERAYYADGGVEKDKIRMKQNYSNIQIILNYLENKFKVEQKTVIIPAENDYYLFVVPEFWLQYTYLISLYTLMIRMAQFWGGLGTPADFIKNYDNPLDKELWGKSKVEYRKLLQEGLYSINYKDVTEYIWKYNAVRIHNAGLVGSRTFIPTSTANE